MAKNWKSDFTKDDPYEGMPPDYTGYVPPKLRAEQIPVNPIVTDNTQLDNGEVKLLAERPPMRTIPRAGRDIFAGATPTTEPDTSLSPELQAQLDKAREIPVDSPLSPGYLDRYYKAKEVSIANTKLALDPEQFAKELQDNNVTESISLLKNMGADQATIDSIIPPEKVLNAVQTSLSKIPGLEGQTVDSLANLLTTNPDSFVKVIQMGGMTEDKKNLLRIIGMSETDIEQLSFNVLSEAFSPTQAKPSALSAGGMTPKFDITGAKPTPPMITTPGGKRIPYPMTDAELNSMTVRERVIYTTEPDRWLRERENGTWAKLRVFEGKVKIIAEAAGFNLEADTPIEQGLNLLNAYLWGAGGGIVNIGVRKVAGAGGKLLEKVLPEWITKLAKADIGALIKGSKGKLTEETAGKIIQEAKTAVEDAKVAKPEPIKVGEKPIVGVKEQPSFTATVDKIVKGEKLTPTEEAIRVRNPQAFDDAVKARVKIEPVGEVPPAKPIVTKAGGVESVSPSTTQPPAALPKEPTVKLPEPVTPAPGVTPVPKEGAILPKTEIPQGRTVEQQVSERLTVQQLEAKPVVSGGGTKLPSGRVPGKGVPKPLPPEDPYKKLVDAVTPTETPLKDKISVATNKFLTQYYDRLDTLRGLENKTGVPTHQMAQIVSGASAYGEDLLRTQVRPVLAKLTQNEIKHLEELMVGRRAQDILQKYPGAKLPGGLTGWGDIATAEATLKAKIGDKAFKKIEDAAQAMWKINDENVLKPLLDEGILSKESYNALKASNPHYIDYAREDFSIVDQVENVLARPEASVSTTGIKVMQPSGSIRKLDSPLARSETQVIKTQNLIARNKSAKSVVAGLQKLEEQIDEPLVKYLKEGEAGEHSVLKDTISFFFDGKKVTVEVPKIYAEAAKNLDAEFGNALTNFLQTVAAPLRAGATTYNPAFAVMNPLRDAISAWFRERMIPFSPSYLEGWWAAITKNKLFSDAAKEGVLMSGITETQRSTAKLASAATRGSLTIKNPKDVLTYIPRLIQEANIVGERATRIGTYKKLTNAGVSKLEAAIRSRDVTVDFAKSGTVMKLINQAIPFSNASLQGGINTLRVFKNNPKWALVASAPLGITSVMAQVNNARFETSKDIPDYEYRYNWIFQFGEGTDNKGEKFPVYIKVPKGPMGSVLAAPIETFLRIMWGQNDRSVVENLLNTTGSMLTGLSPVEPTISGITPPLLGAGVGLATGQDLFRGVPIIPQGEQARLPEQQFGDETSNVAVALGKKFKVSPRLIDFAIKDYFAGAGETVNWIVGLGLEALGFKPEMYGESTKAKQEEQYTSTQKLTRVPFVRRFIGTKATQEENLGWDKFNETTTNTNREFSQIEDMDALGVRLGSIGSSINNVELTIQERNDYQQMMSDEVIKRVNTLISTDDYQKASDEEKRNLLQDVMGKAKSAALDTFQSGLKIEGRRAMTLTENSELAEGRLGNVSQKGELGEPDKYYKTSDLDNKFSTLYKGIEIKEVEKPSPIVSNWYEKETAKATVNEFPKKSPAQVSKSLIGDKIKLDDILTQIGDRRSIVDPEKLKEFDSKHPNALALSKLSGRQLDVLAKYHSASPQEQQDMLKQNPWLSENKYEETLINSPEDNARLALWGEAKLLTMEAYESYMKLIDKLDLVDSALPEDITPKNLPVFKLQTEKTFRDTTRKLDAVSLLDDEVKDANGLTARDRARAELYKTKVGNETYIDTKRRIDLIEKGTTEKPIDTKLIDAVVVFKRRSDVPGDSTTSAEANLDRLNNPELDALLTNKDIMGDDAMEPLDKTRVPIWEIERKDRKYLDTIKSYSDKTLPGGKPNPDYKDGNLKVNEQGQPDPNGKFTARSLAIAQLNKDNQEAFEDTYRSEVYTIASNASKATGTPYVKPDDGLVQSHVDYMIKQGQPGKSWNSPDIQLSLIDQSDPMKPKLTPYGQWRLDNGFMENAPDFTKIPIWNIDVKYEKQDAGYEEILGKYGAGQTKEQTAAINAYLDKPENLEYKMDRRRRDAYKAKVPGNYVETYAQFYTKPKETPYDDEWFMLEHMDYYRDVWMNKDIFPDHKPMDFRKVPMIPGTSLPDRVVYQKYVEYQNLPTDYWRDLYRKNNPDLEAWGVIAFGWIPIRDQKKYQTKPNARDQALYDIEQRQAEIDKKLAGLKR